MSFANTASTPQPEWTRQDTWAWWFYRIGGYVLLNLMDEPAWLALLFC